MFEIGTGSLLSGEELIKGKIPRISAKSDNNGILGYYDTANNTNSRHFKNFISVNFFGTNGGIFYHKEKTSVEMKVHTLKIPNKELNDKIAKFIISTLKNSLTGFGYGNQLSSSKLRELNFKIQLPTKNGEIDFDFMENFIKDLETERIEKLDAYLVENGLHDYELSAKEKQVLLDFEKDKIKFGEFKIGELFNINSYKKRFDANKIVISKIGKPYVVRTSLNNGVRGYINEDDEFLNDGNTISFGQDTATMFYQKNPYFTGDKIKIVKSKDNRFNKNNALFFIATMTKSFSSFSWGGSSFNVKIIANQIMKLPIKSKKPDYEIMETLISAIQKTVIKDVVLYVKNKGNC